MNREGQLGNGVSGIGSRKLTPVFVLRGEQPEDPCNPDPNLTSIVAVSAGADHSMALEKLDPDDPNLNGFVYTWGANKWPGDGEGYTSGRGKLGNGTVVDLSETAVQVLRGEQDYNEPNHVYLKAIVAISAGWNHCMALEKYEVYDSYLDATDPNYTGPDPNHKGRVYIWGDNGQGWAYGWKKSVFDEFFVGLGGG